MRRFARRGTWRALFLHIRSAHGRPQLRPRGGESRRGGALADLKKADLFPGLQQLRPRRRMDGVIRPGADARSGVGGVDDGVGRDLCDIIANDPKRHRLSSIHSEGSDVLARVRAAFQIADQDLGAGMAVAVGPVVVETDAVIIAHVVELMADAGQEAAAHGHRAQAFDRTLPVNAVIAEAAAQDRDVEARVVGNEDPRGQERLDLLPEFREGRRVEDGLLADPGELYIEPVEGLLGIDQGV